MKLNKQREFYITTMQGKDYYTYESEKYKLSEIELLTLIKICIVENRSKVIGNKILDVYRDCTENSRIEADKLLASYGIKHNGTTRPTKTQHSIK